tara:strand:+ start:2144 stop:3052 length:909 start_codon:yes stop_codon:yes gene_type:complete
MDLYLLNELNKLEAGGGGSSASTGSMFLPASDPQNYPNDVNSWPIITRINDRDQTDNWAWSSNSPYTSFYTYGANGSNDAEFGVYDCIGASYTENTQMDNWTTGTNVQMFYSNGGDNAGNINHHNTKWSGQSYPCYRTSLMWLRNKSGSTQNLTVYARMSSNWSSGHDGASMWIGKPNSADKGQVSSINWQSDTYTGTTTDWQANPSTSSIGNDVTVCVLVMHTLYYHQDSSNLASWQDNQSIFELQSLWNNGWRPDYNMYKTCLLARDYNWNVSGGAWGYAHANRVRNLYRLCDYEFPETP